MENLRLFEPLQVGSIALKNRIVMSPMTRCRAIGNVPNELMAEYYGQRAGAGLIITEGTAPSPNGLGYARIPGIYSEEQVEGWKKVTTAVHAKGGKIVLQIMHTGRIAHPDNMPAGATILAPSAVKPAGQMWTDTKQMQEYPTPKAMTAQELIAARTEFVKAAKNAMIAGFDGIELHAANGYLLEQFLSPVTNTRTDNYGGSIENRARFVLEVVGEVAAAIGKDKTGIRLSPYGMASDMPHYPEIDATYKYLAEQLNIEGIAYVHVVDHAASGGASVPIQIKQAIRDIFKNTVILAGGHTKESAEAELQSGLADLEAFGRPFIINPDLAERFANGQPIATNVDVNVFFSADEKGYTDYPVYQ